MLFFGMLKDITGVSEDKLELAGGGSLAAVFEHYAARFPRLRELAPSIVLARNQEFAAPDAPVFDGDEVAFLPPVSGGSDVYTHEIHDEAEGNFYALTRQPIDARAMVARLVRGEDGAVVCFEGVTRNNSKGRQTESLNYECYEAMAVKTMAEIGRALAGAYAIGRIAIVHRLGRLKVGEASVVIVVTAPHRRPAFEASLEAIDRLKRLVPIWKKEYFVDGEVWVEGAWDESAITAAGKRRCWRGFR
ncbi:MAG: molybdenum cofactor biosynthesis protein MoaE [Bryobacteraceae bacterium]